MAPLGIAYWASWVVAWKANDTEAALSLLWRRVAYATRYGRATLGEALNLDPWALGAFCEAVSEIVSQENKSGGGLHDT